MLLFLTDNNLTFILCFPQAKEFILTIVHHYTQQTLLVFSFLSYFMSRVLAVLFICPNATRVFWLFLEVLQICQGIHENFTSYSKII